jgi:Tfp pilus assembly protein PilF
VLLVVAGSLVVLGAAVIVGEREARRGAGRGQPEPEQVLAEVPARAREGGVRVLEQLARQLAVAPRDADTAARVARLALAGARRTADPRLLGRAQAALAPWWGEAVPPRELLLLRATVKQARHDFDGALADVEGVLAAAPDDVQALLLRATVLTVRGRFDEAVATCARVPGFAGVACAAPGWAGHGDWKEALARLERALGDRGASILAASPAERAWGQSLAGEIAYWAADTTRAARHLRAALAVDPSDGYTRLLLADLLLDEARPREVLALLAGREADDASLLRLALAERAVSGARANALARELGERHAGARRRGDGTHAREEARYLLLVGDARAALARATESWSVQHEPWDARVVLAAAGVGGGVVPAEVAAFVAARGAAWRRVVGGGSDGRDESGPWSSSLSPHPVSLRSPDPAARGEVKEP